jgi:hypothetical protein
MLNWGVYCGPSGLVVIDVDNKGGTDGTAELQRLLAEHEQLPKTLTVGTTTGGFHIYFKGSTKSRSKALGPGLDIKSKGGYVVAPGSRIDDRQYEVIRDNGVAELPGWVRAIVGCSDRPSTLPEGELLPEGDRNNTLTRIGGGLRAQGVGYDAIRAALDAVSEHHFEHPLPADEVATIARSVSRYEPRVAKAAADFPELPAAGKEPNTQSAELATILKDIDFKGLRPRKWFMRDRYISGFLSLLVSPGGVGKSTLTVLDALSLATGKPLSGFGVPRPVPVWMYNTEDPPDELYRRFWAMAIHHKVDPLSIGNIHISSGDEAPLVLAKTDKGDVVLNEDAFKTIKEYILKHGIKVMIIDPFVQSHALDENNNMQIARVTWALGRIARLTGCSILLVHHTRKPNEDGITDMHDARGASALVNAVRIAHVITTMTEEEAVRFGLPVERRRWYMRLDSAKANLNPPAEYADWYEKVNVSIPNGDDVGVLERVPLRDQAQERLDQAILASAHDVCRFLDGRSMSIAELHRQLTTDPGCVHLFESLTSVNRAREYLIKLAKTCPVYGDYVYNYEYREDGRPKHWVVASGREGSVME